MKYQPINNYLFSEMPDIEMPQAIKDEIAKRGITVQPSAIAY